MLKKKSGSKPRILVVGAGNIGSIFASKFHDAGHEVALVARNERLQDLQQRGLRVTHRLSKQIRTLRLETLESIQQDSTAEIVIVTVQRHQVEQLMPQLAAHPAKTIIFALNYGKDDSDLQQQLNGRLVWAFPAMLGAMHDGIVDYVVMPRIATPAQITTVGPAGGGNPELSKAVVKLLNHAGVPSVFHPDMRSWLASHVALMLPMMAAGVGQLTKHGQIKMRPADALRVARAQQQSFAAVKAAGLAVEPTNMKLLERVPAVAVGPALWASFLTKPAQDALSGHADHAVGEVNGMYEDMKAIAAVGGCKLSALDKLMADVPKG